MPTILLNKHHILRRHAAGLARIEPEKGTLGLKVTVVNDANASGGTYVLSGSIPSPTNSPTPIPTSGLSYFVSPTGSDTNPGTQSAPFKTITKAVSLVNAGDIVHVAPGTYPERVSSSRSGTASSHIRFVCDTKWTCTISPADAGGSGWAAAYGWRNAGSYVEIDGFEITPGTGGNMNAGIYFITNSSMWALNNKIHHISVAGMTAGPGGVSAEIGTTNTYMIGNWIYDIGTTNKTHGVYCASGVCNIVNNLIGNVSGYGINLWHVPHDVNIINNTVFNTGQSGSSSSGGIAVGAAEHPDSDARNCIIANNIIYGSSSVGISEGGTVHNNKFINNLLFNNYRNWHLISGIQSGTIIADPMFVNYQADGTGDYRLRTDSPAIDKASTQYAPITDADGKNRTAADIGAYEF